MSQDPAWRVIQTAFRTAAELQNLLAFLKEHCSPQDYRSYSSEIATAIDSINVQLTGRVLSVHPELEKRIETELANSGRIA